MEQESEGMTDFNEWIDSVSRDESDFIKRLKARYVELTDRYCPDLDEQGKRYLTECETVFHLQSLYNGLSFNGFEQKNKTAFQRSYIFFSLLIRGQRLKIHH